MHALPASARIPDARFSSLRAYSLQAVHLQQLLVGIYSLHTEQRRLAAGPHTQSRGCVGERGRAHRAHQQLGSASQLRRPQPTAQHSQRAAAGRACRSSCRWVCRSILAEPCTCKRITDGLCFIKVRHGDQALLEAKPAAAALRAAPMQAQANALRPALRRHCPPHERCDAATHPHLAGRRCMHLCSHSPAPALRFSDSPAPALHACSCAATHPCPAAPATSQSTRPGRWSGRRACSCKHEQGNPGGEWQAES